jgi:hypothetical protein
VLTSREIGMLAAVGTGAAGLTIPPVAINVALPGRTGIAGTVPGVRISAFSTSGFGCRSLAPVVSLARSANPSTLERSKPGTSTSAMTAHARMRPSASDRGIVSAPSGRIFRCC